MSMQEKIVIPEFIQDHYLPSEKQDVVKYVSGKGNNLHEVENTQGSLFLVSMPKKYQQTVWLEEGDCLVIDPIVEGSKIKGEIVCIVPAARMVELISNGDWPSKCEDSNDTRGDSDAEGKEKLLEFFQKLMKQRNTTPSPIPSDSKPEEFEVTSDEDPSDDDSFASAEESIDDDSFVSAEEFFDEDNEKRD